MAGFAVAGAGLVGVRHLAALRAAGLRVPSVIDPRPDITRIAAAYDVPHYTTLNDGLAQRPEALILATPNAHHREGALAAIAAGVPVLVEKPIATRVDDAREIVVAGEAAGIPVLTGHHRRHLPISAVARAAIAAGDIGRPVAAHAMFWLAKPDSYFETPWRRSKGAGPLFMNAIHDIDLLRFLLGDIASARAVSGNQVRGHEIEDTCAALLTFENGVLGTLQCSDAVVAPWSYEFTAHDNAAYSPTDQNALWIGGTHGSLALPRGDLWHDGGRRDWWAPIQRVNVLRDGGDPLVAQLLNFRDVIKGVAEPVCSAREGMKSLAALLAIASAAETDSVEVPQT